MRILSISSHNELRSLMQDINVDPYGIRIMLPKAQHCLLKINSLSSVSANILKQEMLSLGGDVALARQALTGKVKKTNCLVMGSLSQLDSLRLKLSRQPFGLDRLSHELLLTLNNYQRSTFQLKAGNYRISLGDRSCIMGIVNVTSDSFSGDGLLHLGLEEVVEYAMKLIKDGADIIDVGGESSRPGSKGVSSKEEASRVIPVIKKLSKKVKVPISIDTSKPEVAKMALDCGASIVNDISGLRNPKMAKIISSFKAAVVVMHMLREPHSMQKNPVYNSLIDDISGYLKSAVEKAEGSGINKDSIIIDPGICFGKTLAHNLEILKRLKEFKSLGKPILIGASRKSFIGKILNKGTDNRLFGSIASCVCARRNSANILRVHDVKEAREALEITDNIQR